MSPDPLTILAYITMGALLATLFFVIGDRLYAWHEQRTQLRERAASINPFGELDDYEDFTAQDGQVSTGLYLVDPDHGQLIHAEHRFAARRAVVARGPMGGAA